MTEGEPSLYVSQDMFDRLEEMLKLTGIKTSEKQIEVGRVVWNYEKQQFEPSGDKMKRFKNESNNDNERV